MTQKTSHTLFSRPAAKTLVLVLIMGFVFAIAGFYITGERFRQHAVHIAHSMFDLPVSIKQADISYISDTVKLKGITIYNPIGFDETQAMITIDEVRLAAADLSNPAHIILNKARVQGVSFHAIENDMDELNLTIFYDHFLAPNPNENNYQLSLIPAEVYIQNATLHYNGSVLELDDQSPLSTNDQAVTASLYQWIKTGFHGYGYPLFQAMITIKVQQGLDKSKALTDNIIKDLKVLGESLESSITDTFGLKP